MKDSIKKMLLQECIPDAICDFLVFSSGDKVVRLINNTEDFYFMGNTYKADSFDLASGDPAAADASISVTITDTDRVLTELIQSAVGTIEAKVFTLRLKDTSSYIEGPDYYKVENVSLTSADSKVTVSMGRRSVLSYNASSASYNNRNFPGLF